MKFSKFFIVFSLIGIIVSCKCKTNTIDQSYYYEQIINNITSELEVANDSIIVLNNILTAKDSIHSETVSVLNSCDVANDSLRSELFVANYKLGRIKEYCDIVKRDNTQLKFLRGWINRVLED